ncbi:alpha/beta fold hydrolase [Streptomyces flavofungini]|uniref:alpha/beta fold hydrolase n=1 Tax=Streptomyces flavofungini TaxID=68200 RepID=UPI0034DDF51E
MLEVSVRALRVSGLSYAYRLVRHEAPRTEPLVALGGIFQGMLHWPDLEDAVTPVTSLVTADLPGAGASDPLRREHDSNVLSMALDNIITDLGVPRVNLYGYSYGSTIAFRYAQLRPDRVARLVLGGVPARITEDQLARCREAGVLYDTGDPQGFATLVAELSLCRDRSRYVHRRDLAYSCYRRALLHATRTPNGKSVLEDALYRRPPLTGGLKGVPTLVFTGEHDTVSTAEEQRRFASSIAGSDFVTIPDSDHLVPLERPEAVTSLIASYLTLRTPAWA